MLYVLWLPRLKPTAVAKWATAGGRGKLQSTYQPESQCGAAIETSSNRENLQTGSHLEKEGSSSLCPSNIDNKFFVFFCTDI